VVITRIVVINTRNTLLSGAIMDYLRGNGAVFPEKVTDPAELLGVIKALDASAALLEVAELPGYTLEDRLEIVRKARQSGLSCKIALLCDENSDQALAEKVKNAKKNGQIDFFFYASVSGEYLAAMLEAL